MASLEQYAPRRQLPLDFLVTTDEAQASSLTLADATTQLYIDIVRETTEIYLLRANATGDSLALSAAELQGFDAHTVVLCPSSDTMALRLAEVRRLFEMVDPSAPGSHTQVWPAFVAAAESRSEDDRAFFTAVLQRIWEATGYANVLKGLDALPQFWEQQRLGRNWTALLPTLKTVVM